MDGTLTEPLMGQLGPAGANKYEGGGGCLGESGHLHVRETSFSHFCAL